MSESAEDDGGTITGARDGSANVGSPDRATDLTKKAGAGENPAPEANNLPDRPAPQPRWSQRRTLTFIVVSSLVLWGLLAAAILSLADWLTG